MTNTPVDFAAVRLQLGFTGATSADAAAELRHLHTASRQARQQVLQLRQFHLQLAFAGARVAGKDIENELGAVDHSHVERALQVTLLRRRQLVIEDDQVGRTRSDSAFQLFQLSAADEGRRLGSLAPLQEFADDGRSGAGGQLT